MQLWDAVGVVAVVVVVVVVGAANGTVQRCHVFSAQSTETFFECTVTQQLRAPRQTMKHTGQTLR